MTNIAFRELNNFSHNVKIPNINVKIFDINPKPY